MLRASIRFKYAIYNWFQSWMFSHGSMPWAPFVPMKSLGILLSF